MTNLTSEKYVPSGVAANQSCSIELLAAVFSAWSDTCVVACRATSHFFTLQS